MLVCDICWISYEANLHEKLELATLYLPFTLSPLERLAQGREATRARYRGLPSRSCRTRTQDHFLGHMRKWYEAWELCLSALQHMHDCSNLCCYSQVQRRQVVHYFQRALISGGAASSSALLQWKIKPAYSFKATCHMHLSFCDVSMTFHIILWQFNFLSFFKSMCLMVGNVRGTKSAWFLVFARVLELPSEERPRFVPIFAWKVGRSLGRMGGWWQHRKFDQQLWVHISSRQQVQRLNIWRLFVHRWPFLLHVWSKSIFFNKLESYMYIYIHTY